MSYYALVSVGQVCMGWSVTGDYADINWTVAEVQPCLDNKSRWGGGESHTELRKGQLGLEPATRDAKRWEFSFWRVIT